MRFLAAFKIERIQNKRGFTLMELLLAATILTVVMSSSYSIFWMGLQIWKFSRGRGNVEKKIVLALEKMGKDLRSAVRVSDENRKTRGSGNQTEVRIPSMIRQETAREELTQYGYVVYRWESARHSLCRQEITASDIYKRSQPPCKEVAAFIRNFQMKYLIYEGVGEAYSWYDSWDENDMTPLAVEIRIDMDPLLKGEKVPFERSYHKVVFIPTGEKIIEVQTSETESPVPQEGVSAETAEEVEAV